MLVAGMRAEAQVPLPRPRPTTIGSSAAPAAIPQTPAVVGSPPPETAEPEQPSACQARLMAGLAVVQLLPPIVGPGACGATDLVQVEAVVLADKSRIEVVPAATIRCTLAEAIVHWVRDEVVPAARELGTALRGLENYDSFDCRGRNRVAGAKISEHGRANALDIKAVRLADGRTMPLTDFSVPKPFRERLRASACERFTTVLGPGSDGYHENHVHVDLAERRNGYRLCQWNLDAPAASSEETAEIPLPRPRPPELAARTPARSERR